MVFEARLNMYDTNPPSRCYICNAGIDVFNNRFQNMGIDHLLEAAFAMFRGTILGVDAPRFRGYDFLVGVLWGDVADLRRDIIIDFVGYKGLKNWGSNYDIKAWNLKNGVWQSSEFSTCSE